MASCSWLCPLCKTSLSLDNGRWVCASKHSFDVAKEGYVNLLPAQNKKSRTPGDSKAMTRARRDFLSHGFFTPMAERVVDLVDELTSDQLGNSPVNILDCGCGEGYYTAQLNNGNRRGYKLFGLDISKSAVQLAAKTYKGIEFAVGSAFSIPLADHSLHVIVQIFSPSADLEIHKKLQAGSFLVRVSPGENHLSELKSTIYESTNRHVIRPPDQKLFSLNHRETCSFTIVLENPKAIENLLTMTPHYWKAPAELKETLLAKESLHVTADFVISCYVTLATN